MCWSERGEDSAAAGCAASRWRSRRDLARSSPVSWRACCSRSEALAHLVLVRARRGQRGGGLRGEQVAQQARLGAQLARQLARELLQE
ncbi:unnamed protein product [Parnassius apollo]|uniref:(apollo) hypothetical protein n=1 Tax=Parnassius apollo TaxID=110799 RepID=A0A8S3XRH7_PARAO|nr:unnamed protein product [Parnassius apollo]